MKIKRNISDQKQVKSPGKDGLRCSEKRLFFGTAWVWFDFKSRELGWSEEKQQRSRFQREWDMRPSAWGSEILLPIVYAHPVWAVFFFPISRLCNRHPLLLPCDSGRLVSLAPWGTRQSTGESQCPLWRAYCSTRETVPRKASFTPLCH